MAASLLPRLLKPLVVSGRQAEVCVTCLSLTSILAKLLTLVPAVLHSFQLVLETFWPAVLSPSAVVAKWALRLIAVSFHRCEVERGAADVGFGSCLQRITGPFQLQRGNKSSPADSFAEDAWCWLMAPAHSPATGLLQDSEQVDFGDRLSMLLRCHNRHALHSEVAEVLDALGRPHLRSIVEGLLRRIPRQRKWLTVALDLVPRLLELHWARPVLLSDGSMDIILEQATSASLEKDETIRAQARQLLGELWALCPTYMEDRPETTSNIMALLENGCRSAGPHRINTLRVLFRVLESSAGNCHMRRALSFFGNLTADAQVDLDLQDVLLVRLASLLRATPAVPLDSFIDPFVESLATSGCCRRTVIWLREELNTHPALTSRHRLMLAHLLGKIALHDRDLSRDATLGLVAMVARLDSSPVAQSYIEQFAKVALSRFLSAAGDWRRQTHTQFQCDSALQALMQLAQLSHHTVSSSLAPLVATAQRQFWLSQGSTHAELQRIVAALGDTLETAGAAGQTNATDLRCEEKTDDFESERPQAKRRQGHKASSHLGQQWQLSASPENVAPSTERSTTEPRGRKKRSKHVDPSQHLQQLAQARLKKEAEKEALEKEKQKRQSLIRQKLKRQRERDRVVATTRAAAADASAAALQSEVTSPAASSPKSQRSSRPHSRPRSRRRSQSRGLSRTSSGGRGSSPDVDSRCSSQNDVEDEAARLARVAEANRNRRLRQQHKLEQYKKEKLEKQLQGEREAQERDQREKEAKKEENRKLHRKREVQERKLAEYRAAKQAEHDRIKADQERREVLAAAERKKNVQAYIKLKSEKERLAAELNRKRQRWFQQQQQGMLQPEPMAAAASSQDLQEDQDNAMELTLGPEERADFHRLRDAQKQVNFDLALQEEAMVELGASAESRGQDQQDAGQAEKEPKTISDQQAGAPWSVPLLRSTAGTPAPPPARPVTSG